MNVIRWIFFIPAGFLGSFIVSWAVFLFFKFTDLFVSRDDWFGDVISYSEDNIIIPIASAFAFVAIGVYVVPSKKKTVAFLLTLIMGILALVNIFAPYFIDLEKYDIARPPVVIYVSLFIGLIGGYFFSTDEN
jgi:hypothetical protein